MYTYGPFSLVYFGLNTWTCCTRCTELILISSVGKRRLNGRDCVSVEALEYQSGTFFSWRGTSVWLCCELKDGQFDYFGIDAPPWPLVHVGRRIWGENY